MRGFLALVATVLPALAAAAPGGRLGASAVSASGPRLTACPDPFEDDDGAAAATPIALDQCQLHNHCDDGTDWLSFAATAGEALVVATCNQGPQSDTVVRVYDPGLSLIAEDDDAGSCDLRASAVRFTPALTGSHYAEVVSYDGSSGADRDYLVCLDRACAGVDPYEEDDDPLAARPIAVGECQGHDHCDDSADWLRLDLTAGEVYSLQTCNLGSRSDTVLALYDPDLQLVASDDNRGPCGGLSSLVVHAATRTGVHYLSVVQKDRLAGAERGYQICLAAGCVLADPYEPDDDQTRAAAIAIDQCQQHNHCDDGADWQTFPAQPGESFLVETCNRGSDSDTWVRVFGPTLNLVAEDDDSGRCSPGASSVLFTATEAGMHLIEVTSFDTRPGADREYDVCLSGGCSSPDAYEPDDDSTAARPLAVGACQDRDHCDDLADWLRLALVAGQAYTVSTCDLGAKSDTVLALFDPTLAPIAADDNGGPCDASASALAFTAVQTGDHYLEVGQAQRSIGDDRQYRVCLAAGCLLPDPGEPDDDPASAAPLARDSCHERNHCDDDSDWLAIPANAGERLRVETCNLGIASDTRIRLHAPDLSLIAEDDDSGSCDPAASALLFTASQSGTHYLEVSQASAGAGPEREYRVCLLSSCLGPDPYEDDDAAASAVAIAPGQCQNRDHCDDGSDWLRLSVVAGETYTLRTCNRGSDSDTTLDLYAPGLVPVASDDDSGPCDPRSSAIVFTAAAGGDYLAEVRQAGGASGSHREYQICAVSGPLVATLLRNDSITGLAPVTPSLASLLPLTAARDAYLASVAPGSIDPDPSPRSPLVLYQIDLALESLALVKDPSGGIAFFF